MQKIIKKKDGVVTEKNVSQTDGLTGLISWDPLVKPRVQKAKFSNMTMPGDIKVLHMFTKTVQIQDVTDGQKR